MPNSENKGLIQCKGHVCSLGKMWCLIYRMLSWRAKAYNGYAMNILCVGEIDKRVLFNKGSTGSYRKEHAV